MQPEDQPPRSEREQTDESLRAEREKADQTLDDAGNAIDETADAVISRARSRADEVLAASRAKTDRLSSLSAPGTAIPKILKSERVREDQVLQEERANADQILREERADHLAVLSREREETDKDLSNERELSDDALATRDEFLGIVSHDLRTMLNAMIGSAALIEKGAAQTDLVEQVVVHARRIQRSGARMNRLIGDLVDIASIEAGVLTVTRDVGDPAIVVAEAVDNFQAQAAASGVSLAAEIVPPPSLAAFDSARILQVLTNLLSNAIKFTPAPGKIVVSVGRFGDEIRLAVRDTGVGITADQLEAVFVRFLQVTKNDRRGVGLGLYISKAIVQGHGGRIWAESKVGEGSTFSFTLPIDVASGARYCPADHAGWLIARP
jgi:signal transduction histidine kinase